MHPRPTTTISSSAVVTPGACRLCNLSESCLIGCRLVAPPSHPVPTHGVPVKRKADDSEDTRTHTDSTTHSSTVATAIKTSLPSAKTHTAEQPKQPVRDEQQKDESEPTPPPAAKGDSFECFDVSLQPISLIGCSCSCAHIRGHILAQREACAQSGLHACVAHSSFHPYICFIFFADPVGWSEQARAIDYQ